MSTRLILARLLKNLGTSDKIRCYIRDWVIAPHIKIPPVRSGKYKKRIALALNFDNGWWKYAGTTITSLLSVSGNYCAYDIYCLISDDLTKEARHALTGVVSKFSPESKINFISAGNDFKHKFQGPGAWPIASYYRLMLPKLLPDLDRVIYVDSDMVFIRDMSEADSIDLGNNLFAACKWNKSGYCCSAFLIMNLKQMRKENVYSDFKALVKYSFQWPDQDILNLVCKNRILHLDWKYNYEPDMAYGALKTKLRTYKEYRKLSDNMVVLHYHGGGKPWIRSTPLGHIWHKYANMSGLF